MITRKQKNPQDLIQHVALHTMEGGNIDCLHPAQSVVDAMCGENQEGYANQLEDWFERYASKSGIKGKAFKPMTLCVSWTNLMVSFSIINAMLLSENQAFDDTAADETIKLPLTSLKLQPQWTQAFFLGRIFMVPPPQVWSARGRDAFYWRLDNYNDIDSSGWAGTWPRTPGC